ncbi:hypothetical protein jhhlp_002780 [Lomentospora prolificans]|uniref:Uncharacterized protein n=1 Tax=Lomentospora prolificans TaxID=41688 RepID=A0A2N3NF41_9PEZI|nr:hypothetical protein jhhlp_002780 [Lomentospora prolificans]
MVTTRSMDSRPDQSKTKEDVQAGSKHNTRHDGHEEPPSKQRKKSKDEGIKKKDGKKTRHTIKKEETETVEPAQKSPKEDSGQEADKGAGNGAEDASKHKVPPNCLELGMIYFYARPRVEQDDPQGVEDMARSFILLRPIENFDEPLSDNGKTRLCIVPKKTFPTTGRERWISFVSKGNEPWSKVTKDELSAREYETKTKGTRHIPAAILAGAGAYAISKTNKGSNLAYILSQPKELGEVQIDLGLKLRGYFTISTRNPVYPAPKNAGLPEGPKYPQEVMDDFQSLRWIATQPRHLDYDNTQFLMIGHSSGLDVAFKDKAGKGKKEVDFKEELFEGEEELPDDAGEEEIAESMGQLEQYVGKLPKVETSF